jgi:hypothetical protein
MERVRLDVTVEVMKEKAWLVQIAGGAGPEELAAPGGEWKNHWIPDSVIKETDCLAAGDSGYVILEKSWVVNKMRLVPNEVRTTTDEMAELEDQLQDDSDPEFDGMQRVVVKNPEGGILAVIFVPAGEVQIKERNGVKVEIELK